MSDALMERYGEDSLRFAILAGMSLYLVAAVLFLVLAASGVWLWSRRRAGIREHRKNREAHGR